MERGRSSVQRLMKAERWPAKQVICWRVVAFLFSFLFCGPPTDEASAPNKRRRLEWCTSMLQRLGETKRPHSGTSLARLTLLAVPRPFFS